MSAQFGKSVTEVSYLVGIYVLVLGAGPLIWNPFAQTLGRRPVVRLARGAYSYEQIEKVQLKFVISTLHQQQ